MIFQCIRIHPQALNVLPLIAGSAAGHDLMRPRIDLRDHPVSGLHSAVDLMFDRIHYILVLLRHLRTPRRKSDHKRLECIFLVGVIAADPDKCAYIPGDHIGLRLMDNGIDPAQQSPEIIKRIFFVRRQGKSDIRSAAGGFLRIFVKYDQVFCGDRVRDLSKSLPFKERGIFREHCRDRLSKADEPLRLQLILAEHILLLILDLCLQHLQHVAADPVFLIHILDHHRSESKHGDHGGRHERQLGRPLSHCFRCIFFLSFIIQGFSSHKPLHGITPGDESCQHDGGKKDLCDDISQKSRFLRFYRTAAYERHSNALHLYRRTDILLSVVCLQGEVFLLQVLPCDAQVTERAVFGQSLGLLKKDAAVLLPGCRIGLIG